MLAFYSLPLSSLSLPCDPSRYQEAQLATYRMMWLPFPSLLHRLRSRPLPPLLLPLLSPLLLLCLGSLRALRLNAWLDRMPKWKAYQTQTLRAVLSVNECFRSFINLSAALHPCSSYLKKISLLCAEEIFPHSDLRNTALPDPEGGREGGTGGARSDG